MTLFIKQNSFNGEREIKRFFSLSLILLILVITILPQVSLAAGQFEGYGVKLNGDNYEIQKIKQNPWNDVLTKYSTLIMGVAGITTLTLSGALVVSIAKLGTSAGNPMARSQAISGLLWTGIAIALMGGGGIVLGFFYYLLS